MKKPTRREVLLRGASFVTAVSLLTLATRTTAAESACVQIDSQPLREALSYADPSPDAAQTCRNCSFFTVKAGSSCGPCVIMSGPVNATAHCESWSKRPG